MSRQITTAALIAAVLAEADKLVGVMEDPKGSNRGARVEEIQRAGHGAPGDPWCADLYCYGVRKGLETLSLPYATCSILRSGSCDMQIAWGKKHGFMGTVPVRGAAGICVPNPARPWDGTHMFFVEHVLSGGWLKTVEGNSNDDGAREGYECCRRRRRDHRIVYLYWWEAAGLPEVVSVPGPAGKPASGPVRPAVASGHASVTPPARPWTLIMDGETLATNLPVQLGKTYAPARAIIERLGRESEIGWDAEARAVLLGGEALPYQVVMRGSDAYLPTAKLAGYLGLVAEPNNETKTIRLRRAS